MSVAAHFVRGGFDVRVDAATDVGMQRAHNEDAFAIASPAIVAVIDGTGRAGGVPAGEALADALHAHLGAGLALAEALRAAGRDLSRAHPGSLGATAAAIDFGATTATIAHVGECRVYRRRAGAFEPLTRDHTLVEEVRAAGVATADELAQLEARYAGVITRALGFADPAVDVRIEPLADGDRFVLVTDGVHGALDPADLDALTRAADRAACLGAVLAAARTRGHDNATIAIADISAR